MNIALSHLTSISTGHCLSAVHLKSRDQGRNTFSHRLFSLVLVFIFTITLSSSASFYGLSYIRLPLQDSKNSTADLELKFKTYQENAFLFLAAGSSDYFLVYLQNGQLVVKINFGSEETFLAADELQLNDLSWHKVKLKLVKSHLSLTIDQKHNILQRIKGDSQELHIQYGIFLGGQDNFKSLYLGNIRPLRGCIDRVLFNFKDVLEASVQHGIWHNVSPDCDEQFNSPIAAGPNSTISFTEPDSFVLVPGLSSPFSKNLSKLSVHFEVKTISSNAVLVFSPSVNPYKRRYIAAELVGGKVRFAINDGTTENNVQSSVTINEGQWHQIELVASNGQLQLTVDGKVSSTTTGKAWSFSSHQYSNEMLIGGLSSKTDWTGLLSVMLSQNVSLKGCIRSVYINGRFVSLLDALATHQIKGGKCKWHFLCAEADKSPCLDSAECIQSNINQVRCVCSSDSCIRPHFKHKSIVAISEKISQCRSMLQPLRVIDGSSVLINKEVFDNALMNPAKETQFQVIQQPKYGTLETVHKTKAYELIQTFSWNDVLQGNTLVYKNDGISDHRSDRLEVRMQPNEIFSQSTQKSDQCEQIVLVLPIDIVSASDDPDKNRNVIHMKMARNSKKALPHSLLKVNSKKDNTIEYTVGQMLNGGASFFEKVSRPNAAVRDFTESEAVRFVHVDSSRAASPVEVTLYARSSRPDKNEIGELRLVISTYETELVEVANTGLVMAHNTVALIGSGNLSFTIGNETDQSQLIKYEIISGPKYGIVQKLRASSNEWTNATHFSQRQLDRSKVRYVHLHDRPKQDHMQLSVSLNKQQVNRKVTLLIAFVDQLKIVSSGLNRCYLNGEDKEVHIDSSKLSYRTEPVRTASSEIIFTLLAVPLCGGLYLTEDSDKQMQLHISSSISQKDINEGKLQYVKNNSRKCTDTNVDSFDFEVAIVGSSNATQVATFAFDFGQMSRKKNELINSKLSVNEGENATIDSNHLYYTAENEEDIVIKISKQPKNGAIKLLSADHSDVQQVSPNQIGQKKIKERRLIYVHDDSENDTDTFEFTVANSTNESIASGKFFIEVTMKNDNSPIRVIDKPFNVIRNGEKPLLGSDIRYVDADLNSSASNIVYTKTYIPNGNLFFVNGTTAENGFTQADLDRGSIRFRHNGSDIGKAILWVTDGQFYLSGSFEIRASELYVRVVNNTGIVVKHGMNGLITTASLAIETNLDLTNKSRIIFKITSEPKFGQILVNDKMANQFTLEELEDEMVQFESTVFEDETPFSKTDSFSFRVLTSVDAATGGRVAETFEFAIHIYPQSYYNLELVHHNNLTVLEEKTALISSKILLTKHSELKADQIVYRIIEKPKSGHLVNSKFADLSDMAKQNGQSFTFSQKDIEMGKIAYSQNVKLNMDSYSRYWDKLVFEVGNDVIRSGNKTLFIEVIPKLITIQTSNMTVSEGQAAILSEANLFVSHPYYERLVDQFIVIEEPKYGSIAYESPSGMPLTAKSFTLEQLKGGKISYRQDSSEVTNDWMTVVARSNSLDKESLPATMHISISSVNDEAPKVVNNSVAWVWQDGTVQIDCSHLAAVDKDNNPNEILYTTYLSTNGYLIDGDSNTTIDAFTQETINTGKLYFVHVGTEEASFRFHVTDGDNSGITSVFRVKVKQRKLNILANEKLQVSPGMMQSITKRHLRVLSNDNDTERQYMYRVVKAPSFGRIVLEGFKNKGESVSQFTQKDIDENEVLYEQNARINEPIVGDRIVFNVHSEGLSPLENVHFMVEIAVQSLRSVINSNMEEMVQITPVVVKEGQFSAIGTSQINLTRLLEETHSSDKLCLLLLETPAHGLILKNGVSVMVRECVPFRASRNGSLVYMHDHSNTLTDSIQFRLMLIDGTTIPMFNLTVPVEIQQVNDEFPVVINRSPTLKAIFKTKTLITNQTLRARDDDGPSFNLIYQIRRDSNVTRESYFVLQRNDPREEMPVYEFKQSDVDSGRLYFDHRGKELHLIYWFRVKDDESVWCEDELPVNNFERIVASNKGHCSPYYPLKVAVAQLSLQLLNHTAIQLPQGAFQVLITRENLATASKNASPNFIRYKVTKGPFHGYISVDGEQSLSEFSQQMIDNNLVNYHVTNMSSEDYFIVDIVQPDSNVLFYEKPIHDVNVKIVTKPLIKALKPFLVTSPGQQALLSYEYLDASALALHTRSNPLFKILTPPRYGHFKLMPLLHFGENEAASPVEGIKEFTYKEIMDNRIAYVAQSNLDLSYPNEMLIDVIDYDLSASNVQDAHGILVVNVFHNRSYIDLDTLVSTENYLQKISIGLSRQVLLIIVTIMISLVVLVIIMRISSCKKSPHLEQNSVKSLSGNDNLDRCGRQYSSTSLRQTECSSRTSSNSALGVAAQANNQSMRYELPPMLEPNSNHVHQPKRSLLAESGNCPSDLLSTMRPHAPRSDKSEDISPLPPPSLYFINDSSFDDTPSWNKAAFKFDMQERPFHYRTSKEHINRSSGDGTSHSDSPAHHSTATVKVTCKGKPYEQFVHMDNYLSKGEHGLARDQGFYTLTTRTHQLKSPQTQMRNQYWI